MLRFTITVICLLIFVGCSTSSKTVDSGSVSISLLPDRQTNETVVLANSIAGVIKERAQAGSEEEFIPSRIAEIELRTKDGVEIIKTNTNLRGEFSLDHPTISDNQEFLLLIRSNDKRATLNFVYEAITGNQLEIIIADNITFNVQDKRYQLIRKISDNPNQVRPFN
jgi:hypothetical protein